MAQATNPVNEAHKTYSRSSNDFDMSYLHYLTARYADVTPFFVMEGVEGDNITLHSRHQIRTEVLKSPLMSPVTLKKDYIHVPLRAIYPESFEVIYTQPTQGDDAPVNANSYMFQNIIGILAQQLSQQIESLGDKPECTPADTTKKESINALVRTAILLENIISNGSLLATMGYKYSSALRVAIGTKFISYDEWMNTYFYPFLISLNPQVIFDGEGFEPDNVGRYNYMLLSDYLPEESIYDTGYNVPHVTQNQVTPHRLFDLMRKNMYFRIENCNLEEAITLKKKVLNYLTDESGNLHFIANCSNSTTNDICSINLERVVSYHIAINHFYVNSKVDYIYTSKLFHMYMFSVINRCKEKASSHPTGAENFNPSTMFDYNGFTYRYDVFSNNYVDAVVKAIEKCSGLFSGNYDSFAQPLLEYLSNILCFRDSLRYGDYFTGSHPTPLAVGDINTPVVGNEVNTIDLSGNLLLQRFLNSVNRAERTLKDYVKKIFGTDIQPDPYEPKYISHTTDGIGTQEIENTGEKQGAIVSLVRTRSDQFGFNFSVSEPCIILGLISFEAHRIYSRTIERFAFKRDRFDRFNPFMQYAGDQAIYLAEIGNPQSAQNFAYALRNMEYKQRFSQASGGFADNLPAYAFVTDNDASGANDVSQIPSNINPAYIRSINGEFDRFFETLSNYGLAGYYHFILGMSNECYASRAMEFAPSVL